MKAIHAMSAGAILAAGALLAAGEIRGPDDVRHVVVCAQEGRFFGWPANNGVWAWGKEILVGFSEGKYQVVDGHNISREAVLSIQARSTDGGETWARVDPENFVGDGGKPTPLSEPIDFTHPDFAMRVVGTGYHGTEDPRGQFYYSQDRGRTWKGSHTFGRLPEHEELRGLELTPRTDYLVLGRSECLIFMAARNKGEFGSDKVFCARTGDGGRTFEFLSWIVPPSDPHRAVMPQTVRCPSGRLVSAIRKRRIKPATPEQCWVDAYASDDGGRSWAFLGKVGDTGVANGNPPALIAMRDGRLCCVYGNRTKRQILARYSRDEGKTWSEELVIREGYDSGLKDQDLGYPRLVQREDGRLVAMYYWASKEHPHQHIAATIWQPAGP